MSIWHRLQSLFDKESRRPAKPPFLHTAIEGPLVLDEALLLWQASAERSLLYQRVKTAYEHYIAGMPPVSDSIQFVNDDGIGGVVLYCQDLQDIEHLDYLCMLQEHMQQLQTIRYVKNLGDIRSQEVGNGISKSHRLYLKPSIYLWQGGKGQQLHGNITLEYKTTNEKSHLYKITANTYNDHKYEEPKPFSELMAFLWDAD